MAWTERDFNEQATLFSANRTDDLGDVAAAIYQLGALLAERLPKPGARLYTVKRGQLRGVVRDLRFVSGVHPVGVESKEFCVEFCWPDPEKSHGGDYLILRFDTVEDARAEHADLLAAWGSKP